MTDTIMHYNLLLKDKEQNPYNVFSNSISNIEQTISNNKLQEQGIYNHPAPDCTLSHNICTIEVIVNNIPQCTRMPFRIAPYLYLIQIESESEKALFEFHADHCWNFASHQSGSL